MPQKEDGRIVETATEARQGERGPSVLTLLVVSVALALTAMAVVWFVAGTRSGHDGCRG
jgi:hypothetical protein